MSKTGQQEKSVVPSRSTLTAQIKIDLDMESENKAGCERNTQVV